jgi:hypothetical protein
MAYSVFSDLINPTKYGVPNAPTVDPSQNQLDTVTGNAATFDASKSLANSYNDFMRAQVAKSLKEGVPGYSDLTGTLATNLAAQLRGELTGSDLAATQRSSAAAALGQGIGGSPAGAAFSARNLGLRQYQVQQNAQAQTPGYLGTMKALTNAPMYDFTNSFLTPQQRFGQSMTNSQNQWNVQNLKNQMKVQPDPWMKSLAGYGDSVLNIGGALGSQKIVGTGFQQSSFSSGRMSDDGFNNETGFSTSSDPTTSTTSPMSL